MRFLVILILLASTCIAAENSPYLVKHDTAAHVVAGVTFVFQMAW